MVIAVNSTITAPAGTKIYLGKLAPASSFPPLRTDGTVTALASTFAGLGFQLLSTAPAAPTYTATSHGSGVWDNERQIMWLFGAETHTTAMDNAVYGWRASDGKFIKHYDADDKSGYRMDGNGVYWSSAAKNRPWGMHTYRRMRFIPATSELEVVYDAHEHAYITPIFENVSQTVDDRAPPFWYYNVVTGAWRAEFFGESSSFAGKYFSSPVGYDDDYGWFVQDGSFWQRLSKTGVLTSQSVSGKANSQYHSYMHVHNGIAYQVGGNANTYLYSKHPLADVSSSTRYTNATYAALADKDTTNMASVKMPDGRIVIFPSSAAGTILHALILDPVANTVTDTGHTVTGVNGTSNYEFSAAWSEAHNCALLLSHRFSPNRIYAYRPE